MAIHHHARRRNYRSEMTPRHYRTIANPHDATPVPLLPSAFRAVAGAAGPPQLDSPAAAVAALETVQPYLLTLMLRNIASDGFAFRDPFESDVLSAPGCVIASPSYGGHPPDVNQDYVYNWTRDSALVVTELREAGLPADAVSQTFADYLGFARLCQQNAPNIDLACYRVDGQPRTWTDSTGYHIWSSQSDGPALQTLALLRLWDRLDPGARQLATTVIEANLDCLLGCYPNSTYNLWEEVPGHSFFARVVQLRCFAEIAGNTIGLPVPDGLDKAAVALKQALDEHWNGTLYVSVLQDAADRAEHPLPERYDPNIDIVLAALYGALPVGDPRLLATAAAIRATWSDGQSDRCYPINQADAARGLGPLLGRYPDDVYDGDTANPQLGGHPWPVCTAALAELYYRLAAETTGAGAVLADPLAAAFFGQVGVSGTMKPAEAAAQLVAAGDRMLAAILFHSDHYQLSEQFDGSTGYEKSVANLTWSYAAFLSAERARRAASSR
jgi:glucoamylase